jgi:hypothetical protein
MGGSRWVRTALPWRFARPIGLLSLMLLLNNPGWTPAGDSNGDVFLVWCPYDGQPYSGAEGGVTCEGCNNRFVVARCKCGQPDAAAVGIPHPTEPDFESWHCGTCHAWFWAHLCPKCRTLATSRDDGTWQCWRQHPAFLVGRCGLCGWFAGREDSGDLRCEWCGHRTRNEGG